MNGGSFGWASKGGRGASGACDANAKPANLDFTLKDVKGVDVRLSSFKGKVILLDFWATWCAPCKVEIPGFVELQTQYKGKGLVVVGMSVDDTLEQLTPFVAQYKMNYPVLLAKDNEAIQEAFGPLWGLPTTFVISRDGKMCRKHMGLTSKAQFEKEILGLL
jgi:peroxiredoxin